MQGGMQCSKRCASNVTDYHHAQNKLQIKAMLIWTPMLVSVEHQYLTNFKLYWKCRKITNYSHEQNKAEAWPSREVLNMDAPRKSAWMYGVNKQRTILKNYVQNGMEEKFQS